MLEGRLVRLHFRVKVECQLGQVVGVTMCLLDASSVESVDAMEWSVQSFVTMPDTYPLWYSDKPIIVPFGYQVSRLNILYIF